MRDGGRVVGGLAGVVAVAAVIVLVARLADVTVPVWATVGAVAVAAVGWAVQQRWVTPPAAVRRTSRPEIEDSPFSGFHLARRRVDFALEADDGFERSLQPYLRRLAAARFGTGGDGGAEARSRLGERGWQLVYGPPGRRVSIEELEELVRRLQ